MVNGKPFFGKDGKIATQNLPAEIIEKIQVVDTKTKEEEISGESASAEEKTINLTSSNRLVCPRIAWISFKVFDGNLGQLGEGLNHLGIGTGGEPLGVAWQGVEDGQGEGKAGR